MRRLLGCWLGVIAAMSPPLARAHHSFAAFDMQKTERISGIVKDFEWTNPHTWLIIEVGAADATAGSWRFEGGAPPIMTRGGWSEDLLQMGDRVTIEYHPRRDGSHGGNLAGVYLAGGRHVGTPATPPPAGSQ